MYNNYCNFKSVLGYTAIILYLGKQIGLLTYLLMNIINMKSEVVTDNRTVLLLVTLSELVKVIF